MSHPALVHKEQPAYTLEAVRARVEGTVVLNLEIDAEGNERSIQVRKPLGYGLDESAIAAVHKRRFRPAKKDGQPVRVRSFLDVLGSPNPGSDRALFPNGVR